MPGLRCFQKLAVSKSLRAEATLPGGGGLPSDGVRLDQASRMKGGTSGRREIGPAPESKADGGRPRLAEPLNESERPGLPPGEAAARCRKSIAKVMPKHLRRHEAAAPGSAKPELSSS